MERSEWTCLNSVDLGKGVGVGVGWGGAGFRRLIAVTLHCVTMNLMASQITSLGIVYSTVYSCADQRKHKNSTSLVLVASQITSLTIVYSTVPSDADKKHQSPASLAFVLGIHRGPVNSPHKRPVARKMFPFDDVIMIYRSVKTNYKMWYWITTFVELLLICMYIQFWR